MFSVAHLRSQLVVALHCPERRVGLPGLAQASGSRLSAQTSLKTGPHLRTIAVP